MISPSSDLTPNELPDEPEASAVILPPTSFIELSADMTDSSSPRSVDVASSKPPVISTSDADTASDTASILFEPPDILTVPEDWIPLPSDFI